MHRTEAHGLLRAMRPGKRRKLEPESAEALAERNKASVRAKVEHPFLKVKRVFGYAKVRYRGLLSVGKCPISAKLPQ